MEKIKKYLYYINLISLLLIVISYYYLSLTKGFTLHSYKFLNISLIISFIYFIINYIDTKNYIQFINIGFILSLLIFSFIEEYFGYLNIILIIFLIILFTNLIINIRTNIKLKYIIIFISFFILNIVFMVINFEELIPTIFNIFSTISILELVVIYLIKLKINNKNNHLKQSIKNTL